MKSVELSQRVISARDVEAASRDGASVLRAGPGTLVTPSARDLMRKLGVSLEQAASAAPAPAPAKAGAASAKAVAPAASGAYGAGAATGVPGGACRHEAGSGCKCSGTRVEPGGDVDVHFFSPEAEAIKKEIVAVGKKLWQRGYVDGNGGNISYRIGENRVICTPTLYSKADLTPDDLCLVDLEANQIAGCRPRTSEILMHLEIYKVEPRAKAVVHCHAPHATAYAVTGRVPPTCVIPEHEVFVGKVALIPYMTPGTQEFADAVVPFVRDHNSILLQNHGIACWADTVTHAEWFAEVLDTYCHTLMLASQLGTPLTHIPDDKTAELMAIKRKLDLPDPRLDGLGLKECQLCDLPEPAGSIVRPPPLPRAQWSSGTEAPSDDVESIVREVTDAVMDALAASSKG